MKCCSKVESYLERVSVSVGDIYKVWESVFNLVKELDLG